MPSAWSLTAYVSFTFSNGIPECTKANKMWILADSLFHIFISILNLDVHPLKANQTIIISFKGNLIRCNLFNYSHNAFIFMQLSFSFITSIVAFSSSLLIHGRLLLPFRPLFFHADATEHMTYTKTSKNMQKRRGSMAHMQ